MKKLMIAAVMTMAMVTAQAGPTLTVVSTVNARIQLAPNGPLDAPPVWSIASTGASTLQVDANALGALLVTAPGTTNTVTINATSQGHPLVDTVTVIVQAAPVPATTLGSTAGAVPK
jgi:hypothetical protein